MLPKTRNGLLASSEKPLRLLSPMALALGLPRDWFAPHFVQPTTFLRLLHYPPQAEDAPDDALTISRA